MTAVSTRYDRELLAEIRRIGFHPFILVRTVDDPVGNRHTAYLRQNEAGSSSSNSPRCPILPRASWSALSSVRFSSNLANPPTSYLHGYMSR